MAALPNFPSDGQGERTDGLVRDDNSVGYKRGVGNITPTGGGQTSANAGVATHTAGAKVNAGDPIVVVAGESGAGQASPLAVDGGGGALPAAYVSAPISLSFTSTSGTLAIGTYYYRVTATTGAGETTPCTEQSFVLAATGGIIISWPQAAGATGYRVYGRTTGAELFIAAVAPGTVTTYTDNGSVTPSGAMPTVNTARLAYRTEGIAAAGSAVAGNPVLVAGTDGTNVHTLVTDSVGRVVIGAPIGNDLTASATGAATALTATLPGTAGLTTFITGFEVTGAGATAASNILVTVTGTISGTLNYYLTVPAGTTTSIAFPPVEFTRPIPASGTNTAIVVNVPSFGSGNTAAAVTVHGFSR
jgi:hypothetical protein